MASEARFELAHGNSPSNRLATDPLKPLGYSDINRGSFLLYFHRKIAAVRASF